MSCHLTPLEVCEHLLGGCENVAEAAGLGKKSAYRWRHASQTRDAGWLPPRAAMAVLKHCVQRKIPLRPEWLITGATATDVAQAGGATPMAAE